MVHSALPVVAQHLVLVRRRIVATMHQAYAALPGVGATACFWPAPPKRPISNSRSSLGPTARAA